MNNTTRIIIEGIFGCTAFIAVKAINCGIMLEATGNEKKDY